MKILPVAPAAPGIPVPRGAGPAPILSPATRNPALLLWIWGLPQALLLLMNLRSLGTIWGEMSAVQRTTGRWLLGWEIVMLVAIGCTVAALRRLGRPVGWALNGALLAVSVGYLGFALTAADSMIPASVSAWILPPESFVYYQFAFVMPAAFFALLQLVCFPGRNSPSVEILIALAVLAGVPLSIAGLVSVADFIGLLPGAISVAFFVGATLVGIGALLRLTTLAYIRMRGKGPVELGVLTALVALAGPIGGLWLNSGLPFPADFQSVGVYAMAVLNGVILLLPNFRPVWLHRAVWLAQCALFPFTLYFFVVFLPFLPLSFFAMIALGAGCLMLVPTALFLLHGQRILDGLRDEIRDGGRIIPTVLGIAACCAIPVVYTGVALYDRQVLGRAIDYTYSPDYRVSGFAGSPAAIGRSLTGLRDFKAGIQLPFISDFYNWIVFDGLVLPDEKVAHLYRGFLGAEMPEPSRQVGESMIFGGNPGRRRNRTLTESAGRPRPFPREVQLATLTPLTESEDAATGRTRVTLTLTNSATAVSEFATSLHVPAGVLVSGFWLHIGAERVPGRIFEKKTALWVYQKIRDVTRCDPGILLYTGAETLELRVFPFADHETRTVELEFLYPAASAAQVRIGGETLALGDTATHPAMVLASAAGDGAGLAVAPGALEGLPTVSRQPYLHFIIDRSANATLEGTALRETITRLAREFPAARECAITAANFDTAELTHGLIAIESLASWDPRQLDRLPKRGGFLRDRALKHAMLRAADSLQTGLPGALASFPVPILLRSHTTKPLTDGDLEKFGEIAPDRDGYFESIDGGELRAHSWIDNAPASFTPAQPPRPVVLLRVGSVVAAVAADRPTAALVPFPGATGELEVWNAASSSWKSAAHIAMPERSRYAQGVGAGLQQVALVYRPALGKEALSRLVALSRSTGVIVPATSYIVVENSAQWRTLEATEKKKLANSAALEMEETPEPTAIVLLACGTAALLARRRRSVSVQAQAP